MAKPSKLSFMGEFDKEIDKAGISSEDTPPKYWYSTGNHVLNKIISNSFSRGIPQGRVTALMGPSGCLPAGETVKVYSMRTVAKPTPIKVEKPLTDDVVNQLIDVIKATNNGAVKFALESNGIIVSKVDGGVSWERASTAIVEPTKLTLDMMVAELKASYVDDQDTLRDLVGDVDNADEGNLLYAFLRHCEWEGNEVDIRELVSTQHTQMILVETPDGFQPISQLFIKESRDIVRVVTDFGYQLRCSTDHLIETATGWEYAGKLAVGDKVLTEAGLLPIKHIEQDGNEPVFDFEVAHENHRYWSGGISSHNSGKSYLAANMVKNAQQSGSFILVLDSENALDSEFMGKIGVDTENDYSYRQVDTIGDVIKVVSSFMKKYREAYPDGDGPEVLILLDSLDMLSTESEVEKFQKGDNSGDQGQRPKQFKAFNRQMVREIKGTNVSMVVTGQVYQATREQLMKGEGAWVVNDAVRYAYSQIILVTKLKLKDDKTKAVTGVRIKAQGFKTRFAKPFQEVELEVPYDTGMDPLSGLLEAAITLGIVTKKGSRYSMTGSEESWYSKELHQYADEILEQAAKFDSLHVASGAVEETESESQSQVTKRRKGKLEDEDQAEE